MSDRSPPVELLEGLLGNSIVWCRVLGGEWAAVADRMRKDPVGYERVYATYSPPPVVSEGEEDQLVTQRQGSTPDDRTRFWIRDLDRLVFASRRWRVYLAKAKDALPGVEPWTDVPKEPALKRWTTQVRAELDHLLGLVKEQADGHVPVGLGTGAPPALEAGRKLLAERRAGLRAIVSAKRVEHSEQSQRGDSLAPTPAARLLVGIITIQNFCASASMLESLADSREQFRRSELARLNLLAGVDPQAAVATQAEYRHPLTFLEYQELVADVFEGLPRIIEGAERAIDEGGADALDAMHLPGANQKSLALGSALRGIGDLVQVLVVAIRIPNSDLRPYVVKLKELHSYFEGVGRELSTATRRRGLHQQAPDQGRPEVAVQAVLAEATAELRELKDTIVDHLVAGARPKWTVDKARQHMRAHLKGNPWPGMRAWASILVGCSAGTIDKAVNQSEDLLQAKEAARATRRTGRKKTDVYAHGLSGEQSDALISNASPPDAIEETDQWKRLLDKCRSEEEVAKLKANTPEQKRDLLQRLRNDPALRGARTSARKREKP